MSPEDSTLSGNAPARDALPHQESGDPALKTVNASYPMPPSHEIGSVVSKSEFARRAWPLCEDPQIFAEIDKWRDHPENFFDGMTAVCNPPCLIYKQIHSSSTKPEIDIIKRRLCLAQYHLLRNEFKKDFFGPGKSDPLRVFLQTHLSKLEKEQALVRENCDSCATAGQKYYDLAIADHPGVLLLLAASDSLRLNTAEVNRITPVATFERIPDIEGLLRRIPYISAMHQYDGAAKEILDMLKRISLGWLNDIKPSSNLRTSVQYLFSNGIVTHASLLGVAPETLVMVKDIGGAERQLDARVLRDAVFCALDTSGRTRYIRVGTWTDICTGLLDNHGAEVQTRPPLEAQPFRTQEPHFEAQPFETQPS
ncbi:hypothetical protein NCS52_01593600 [Fusarium sp. LHS14.1]|nr:hypothetical protein NCS52_01593600 [Fusarium sp. LHS14.1]